MHALDTSHREAIRPRRQAEDTPWPRVALVLLLLALFGNSWAGESRNERPAVRKSLGDQLAARRRGGTVIWPRRDSVENTDGPAPSALEPAAETKGQADGPGPEAAAREQPGAARPEPPAPPLPERTPELAAEQAHLTANPPEPAGAAARFWSEPVAGEGHGGHGIPTALVAEAAGVAEAVDAAVAVDTAPPTREEVESYRARLEERLLERYNNLPEYAGRVGRVVVILSKPVEESLDGLRIRAEFDQLVYDPWGKRMPELEQEYFVVTFGVGGALQVRSDPSIRIGLDLEKTYSERAPLAADPFRGAEASKAFAPAPAGTMPEWWRPAR